MINIRAYVTNLGKYNEGSLVGEWVRFPIDLDGEEFKAIKNRIGINDEYEEMFITDYDVDADVHFGEYESFEYINEIAEALENLTEYEQIIFKAALEYGETVEDALQTDNYCLYSEVYSEDELGEYILENFYSDEIYKLGSLAYYIDTERLGRDFYLERSCVFTNYGLLELIR